MSREKESEHLMQNERTLKNKKGTYYKKKLPGRKAKKTRPKYIR